MTRVRDINSALRSLDAADRDVDPANARALADLHRILAADGPPRDLQQRRSPSVRSAGRPGRAPRTARRIALAAGLLAALTAGMVALPSVTGGDKAFATWTSHGQGMTAGEGTEAAESCREQQKDAAGAEGAAELSTASPVVAERRGVWTTVVLAGTRGFTALCITDTSSRLFAKDMIGSVGTPAGYAVPEPREVIATDLGSGTMNAGGLSLAAGAVGSDVVGLVYRSRTHGDVAATVSQGHFALWWPGDELRDVGSNGIEVEVTHSDGSTRVWRLTL